MNKKLGTVNTDVRHLSLRVDMTTDRHLNMEPSQQGTII